MGRRLRIFLVEHGDRLAAVKDSIGSGCDDSRQRSSGKVHERAAPSAVSTVSTARGRWWGKHGEKKAAALERWAEESPSQGRRQIDRGRLRPDYCGYRVLMDGAMDPV